MKLNRETHSSLSLFILLASALTLSACGGQSTGGSTPAATPIPPTIPLVNGTTIPTMSGTNVLRMSVSDPADCSASIPYVNKPCVTITICNADGTNCTSVNDILVDTGSYGLRIFKQVLGSTVPTQIVTGGKNLTECVEYGDGSKHWGPVATAQVKLGGEPAVSVPMQIIDSTSFGMSTNCSNADIAPTTSDNVRAGGMNGILGVGPLAQDCGINCVIGTSTRNYYACNTTSCTLTTVSLANQVTNPVTALPQDNNGVILKLPDLPFGGTVSSSGYLVLGIGTQTNNIPSNVTKYSLDSSGYFSTELNGHSFTSFLDSGSNAIFFPNGGPVVTVCSSYPDWFCPNGYVTLSGINKAASGSTSGTIQFQIENFLTFLASPSYAIKELGGPSSANLSGYFDWGLSFHFGRNVYVGFEGKSSTLGSGVYEAY